MLSQHDVARPSQPRSRRTGFSLVELLVSITIFVILATIALSAFRDSKHDKVAAASRQISAAIGGARSRASKAIEPRGLRLLRDKLDYRLISGLQYVGQSQLFGGGTLRVQIDKNGVVQLRCVQPGEWLDLNNEGLLSPGDKIYLWLFPPTASTASVDNSSGGRWYTIASRGFALQGEDLNNNGALDPGEDLNLNGVLDTNEQRMQIVGPIDGATWIDPASPTLLPAPNPVSVWQYSPAATPPNSYVPSSGSRALLSDTIPIPYLLRLSAQELPDAEPINLPPGIVIDIPSSMIPSAWRDFEDANLNGTLDVNENDGGPTIPYLPNPKDNGDGVLNNVHFDIPIAPNGTVSGALSGAGPIYLYMCPREDVERMRSMLSTANGGVYGSDYLPGKIPGDFENDYGPDHPSSERRVICIIPQTGLVYIANVNGTDADKDGWAEDPYSFARDGRETR